MNETEVNISVLGSKNTGFFSLISRFVSPDDPEYMPVGQIEKELELNDTKYIIKIFENSGMDEMQGILDVNIKESQASIIVYSITSELSFKEVDKYYEKLKKFSSKPKVVLVGNYLEKENERVVSLEQGMMKANEWGDVPFFEAFPHQNINVQEPFLAAIKLINGDIDDDDIIKIGLFCDDINVNVKIALLYISNELNNAFYEMHLNGKDFFKLVEINNTIMKITANVNNTNNFKNLNAAIFIFNPYKKESLKFIEDYFEQKRISNTRIPYAMVANYVKNEERQMNIEELYEYVYNKFQRKIFEIRDYSEEQIEDVFFYITNFISKQVIKEKQKLKKEKDKKMKIKTKEKKKFFNFWSKFKK